MKIRILVFDDDPVMREMLQQVLTVKGYAVHVFADPAACPVYSKADCICPQHRPCADIVITDMSLASMNGIDFLALQRKRGCKALPANKAVMTNTLTKAQRLAIEGLGARCLCKPFKLVELFAWIDECVARIDPDRELAELELTA